MVLVGDDGGDVEVLPHPDEVPVLHLNGPHHLGLAGIARKVQGGHHGRVGGVVLLVAGLPGDELIRGVLVLNHLHRDLFHQGLELPPGVGAGEGVVDVPPGGPAVLLIRRALMVDVGGGGGAVVGPGHQELVGRVPTLVVHLAHPVEFLGHIGPVEPPEPRSGGDYHRQDQQAQQQLFLQGDRPPGFLTAMNIPGAMGTEGGVFRQVRPAVGTFLFHRGALLYSKMALDVSRGC